MDLVKVARKHPKTNEVVECWLRLDLRYQAVDRAALAVSNSVFSRLAAMFWVKLWSEVCQEAPVLIPGRW